MVQVDAGSAAAGGELPEGARSDPLQAADGWMGPAEPESQGEAQEEGLSMDTRSDDVSFEKNRFSTMSFECCDVLNRKPILLVRFYVAPVFGSVSSDRYRL